MDEKEREEYLKSLYGDVLQEKYNQSLGEKTSDWSEGFSDFDYWKKQYNHDKHTRNQLGKTEYDWETSNELTRLGGLYTPGSQYNQENLWRKQGVGEQLYNASNRMFWNTIGDTIGGFASMIDLPGYVDPNYGVFTDVADWARKQKEETNKANPIYQKEGSGMTGPGMAAWWIENGSSLASSAASFMLQGAGIGKAMQGAKWLASINKIDKYDDLARRGKDLATGETLTGVGKTGEQIAKTKENWDKAQNLISSTALTQSAAMMSATETYANVYQEAIDMGYGEEYAKAIAGSAASNVVNASRANILLNLSSANKFLGGSKNIKSLKPENFLPSLKNKTLGTAIKEGVQEAAEENIELIAQKQAEQLAQQSLQTGLDGQSPFGGKIPGLGILTAPLLTGNVYGDSSWKDITETTLLGAIGGIAQTGLTDLYNRVGSETSFGGLTKRFGQQVQKKYDTNQYYSDGSIKAYAGDPIFETEDNTIVDNTGKVVKDYVMGTDGKPMLDENGKEEVRQKLKEDVNKQPIPVYEDKKYSQKEIENKLYEEQVGRFNAFRKNAEKNATVISTAKYQAQLDKTIGDLNDYVEEGKANFNPERKAKLVDDLARLELVNSGIIDLDAATEKLEDKKKEIASKLETMSAKEIRQKQDELLGFSLSRTAIESFENNTKEPLIEMFKEMQNVSPEKAKELGYPDDYKQKAQEAIDQINSDFNRWMEFNTKRPGNIARALFKNRKQHDYLSAEVDRLNGEAMSEHENALKLHATQNDIDLNKIEGKDDDIRTVKNRYDESFKIEQERIKKELSDKTLKDLESQKAKLEQELAELDKVSKEDIEKDLAGHMAKIKAKETEIDKIDSDISDRKDEVAKPYNERIKALGLSKYNNSKAAEIYKAKLKAVAESKELDRIFDELVSEKGQAKLAKIERDKLIEQLKRKAFIQHCRELADLQDKQGGGIYWGDELLDGKFYFDEKNGTATFNPYSIKPFETFANSKRKHNGVEMTEEEFYRTRVRPDKEDEWKKYKADYRKENKEKLDKAKEELVKTENDLSSTTDKNKELNDAIISLNDIESPGYENRVKEDANNPAAKQARIDRINRINKLLNLPSVTDLTAKEMMNNERRLSVKLVKAIVDTKDLVSKIESLKDEIDTRFNVKSIPVPDAMRLYRVEVEAGLIPTIKVSQFHQSNANVQLDFNKLSRLRTLKKEDAEVKKAQDTYTKAYAAQVIRINNLTTGKAKLYTDMSEARNKSIDERNKLVEDYKVIQNLLDFIQATKLNELSPDHTNPLVNQFNAIIASFKDTTEGIFDKHIEGFKTQIGILKSEVLLASNEIIKIDDEIDAIQRDILARKSIISGAKGKSLGGHKSWLKQLNKTLERAEKTKANLAKMIEDNQTSMLKYEGYLKLITANRGDINFVKTHLNNLAYSSELVQEDLDKINEVIDGAIDQVEHLADRINYSKTLQDEILKALNIRDRSKQVRSDIDNLHKLIYDELTRLGRGFGSDDKSFNEYIRKVVYDAMFSDEMNLVFAHDKLMELGLGSDSDLYKLLVRLNGLYAERNYLIDNAQFKSNLTDVELQNQFEELQYIISRDIESQETIEQFLGDKYKRRDEILAKLTKLDTLRDESLFILSGLNRELEGNFNSAYTKVKTEIVDKADSKIKEYEKTAEKLVESITADEKFLVQLEQEYDTLLNIRSTLVDNYDKFFKESNIEVMNDMLKYLSGKVDGTGKNKLIENLEGQIALIEAENKANDYELTQLANIINLRKELNAMFLSNDFNMSSESISKRASLMNQMGSYDEFVRGLDNDEIFHLYRNNLIPREKVEQSDEELINKITEYQNKIKQTNQANSDKRKAMDLELDMLKLIFGNTQPEIVQATEKGNEVVEIQESANEKELNEGLKEGGDILEDSDAEIAKLEKANRKWQASKPNIFTTVPNDLIWDKDGQARTFHNDGVPKLNKNFNEVKHMEFLNKFALTPNEFTSKHKVEIVQLHKDTDQKDENDEVIRIARNENEPLNNIMIYDSKIDGERTALEAAKIYGGLYAVITNLNGHRAHINDAGDVRYIPVGESVPNGFYLVFNTIPDPKFNEHGFVTQDTADRMGDNMLINYLAELTGKEGKTFKDFAEDNLVVIGNRVFNLSPGYTKADGLGGLKAELAKQIGLRMKSFRKSVETELDNRGNKPLYFPMSDLSKGDLLTYQDDSKRSADWLFDDTNFSEILINSNKKGEPIKTKIAPNVEYDLTSGIPYVVTKQGAVVPFYTEPNNQYDVDLIIELINNVVSSDGKWNKNIELTNGKDFNKVSVKLTSDKDGIGLLNKVINWGKYVDKNGAASKFSIWIQNKQVNFVDSKGTSRTINLDTLKKTDADRNADEKERFKKFTEFLKEKRKHIHFKLITPEMINKPYQHPKLLDTGVLIIETYDSYKKYLSEVSVTSVVGPDAYTQHGFKSPIVGKYFQFSPISTDDKILNDDLAIDGVYIQENTSLVRKSDGYSIYVGKNADGQLTIATEPITAEMLKDWEFEVKKPDVKTTKTVETKVVPESKVEIVTEIKPTVADLGNVSIPVLLNNEKLTWQNSSLKTDKDGKTTIGQNYSKITTVKLGEDYIMEQSLTTIGKDGSLNTYYDYYKVDKTGKISLINDSLKAEFEKESNPELATKSWRKLFDVNADIEKERFKFGSELKDLKPIEAVEDFFKTDGSSLGKSSINTIDDFIDYSFYGFEPNSDSDKVYNMFKAGRLFRDKYIPYITSGSSEFSKDLLVKNEKDEKGNPYISLIDTNNKGLSEISLIKYETSDRPKTLKDLLENKEYSGGKNTVFYKFLDKLGPELGLDKVNIEYVPHLNFEGQYIPNGNRLQLSLGLIVDSYLKSDNKSQRNLMATIAHEYIHHLDEGKRLDETKFNTIRDSLIKWIWKNRDTSNILTKELNGSDGESKSLVAYWLFGKQIDTNTFQSIIAGWDGSNFNDLENKLGIEDSNESLKEFFANILNKPELQQFLNEVKVSDLDELPFKVKRGGSLWDAFKLFLRDFLSLFDISGGITEDSALELILTTGAEHYQKHGGFKNVGGDLQELLVENLKVKSKEETRLDEDESVVEEKSKAEEINNIVEYSGTNQPTEITDDSKRWGNINTASIQKGSPEELKNDLLDRYEDILDSKGLSLNNPGKAIISSLSNEQLSEYSKLSDEELFDRLNTNDDSYQSLFSLESGSNKQVDSNKVIDLYNQYDYEGALSALLTANEFNSFLSTLYSLKAADGESINNNNYIRNLINDGNTRGLEPVLEGLRKYVETNSQTSNIDKMSKRVKELSSSYDFKGEKLSQIELDSIMSAMTHFTFENFRQFDADTFYSSNVNADALYSIIRNNIKTELGTIRNLLSKLQNGEDISKFRDRPRYKVGFEIADEIIRLVERQNKGKKVSFDSINNRVDSINKLYERFLQDDTESQDKYKELVRIHFSKMRNMGFDFSEDLIDDMKITNELTAVKDTIFDYDSAEINQKNVMFPAIKLLVAAQVNHIKNNQLSEKYGEDVYELKTNYLGLPEPNNFDDTYNLLVDTLSNLPGDREILMNALTNAFASEVDSAAGKVLYGLANPDSPLNVINKGGSINYSVKLNDVRLITQFIQTFSKFKPNNIISWYDDNGNIAHSDANVDRVSEIVLSKWADNFKNTLIEKDGSLVFDTNIASTFKAKIKEAYDDYLKTRNFKKLDPILKSVGIEITNLKKVNDMIESDYEKSITKFTLITRITAANSLVDAIAANANNPNYNPFKDKSIKTTLKELSEYEAKTSKKTSDNQYIWDGKTQFSIELNSMWSVLTNLINHAAKNKTLHKDVPHLFNVYNRNSTLIKEIEDGNLKLQLSVSKGLQAKGNPDINHAELDSPDKWSLMINHTMKNHYTFFRTADRKKENMLELIKSDGKLFRLYSDGPAGLTSNATLAFFGYLLDEVNAMVSYRDGLGKNIKFYDKFGGDFRFFSDDKLSTKTKKKIKELIDSKIAYEKIEEYLKSIKGEIQSDILTYFKQQAIKTKAELEDNGLLQRVPAEFLTVEVWNEKSNKMETKPVKDAHAKRYIGIAPDVLVDYLPNDSNISEETYDEALMDLLTEFNLLQYGAYVEQTKIYTGDPAMYKNSDDFFKRMSMLNSTKKVSVVDKTLDKIYNMKNNVELYLDNKRVDFSFDRTQLKDLIKNKYKLSSLNTETQKAIKGVIGNIDLNTIEIRPMFGFHPDYIISDGEYDGFIKSMVGEDISAMSVLAVDKVKRIDYIKGKIVYYGEDGKELNSTNNEFKDGKIPNVSRLRKMFAEAFIKDGITNGTKLNDKVKSYLKPYLEMDESDAQSWVTLPAYKEILLRAGDWGPKHDKIYAKMLMGKEVESDELAYFRVLKTQYSGPMALDDSNTAGLKPGDEVTANDVDKNLFIPTGYKHSLFPLIPQVIKGTNLEKLNDVMSVKGVGLYHQTSANKFGRKQVNKASNIPYDEDGNFILTPENAITQNNSFQYFGIQLDQAPKMKDKITASTQFRKLALSNMLEFGIPVDYIDSETARLMELTVNQGRSMDFIRDKVRANWNTLSETEKLSNSPMYSLYSQYQGVQRELFAKPFEQLSDELELFGTYDDNGKVTSYEIGNRAMLVEILLESNQDASVNVKKSIESLLDPDTAIEQVLTKDKLESVLFAIVNSRVLREKRKGEGSPQVSVSFFENHSIDGVPVKREGLVGTRFSHPALRHYIKGKDGKTLPSHAMIGLPIELRNWAQNKYAGYNGHENYLDGLNDHLNELHAKLDAKEIDGKNVQFTDEENELINIITMIGFRIPNQGLQSADFMRVRKFLPTEVGDSIVVPTEMVAKAGSDFDIDKLNVYRTNYIEPKFDKKTKTYSNPVYVKFSDGMGEASIQSRYDKYIDSYRLKSESEELYNLKRQYESLMLDYSTEIKELNESIKDTKDKMSRLFNTIKSSSDIKNYPNMIEELNKNSSEIFNILPNDIKDVYKASHITGENVAIQNLAISSSITNKLLDDIQSNFDNLSDKDLKRMFKGIANPTVADYKELLTLFLDINNNVLRMITSASEYKVLSETLKNYKSEKVRKAEDLKVTKSNKSDDAKTLKDRIKNVLIENKVKDGAHDITKFGQLSIYEQNTKEALQNKMVELQHQIMEHPYNYRQLMSPISDVITKQQAWNIRMLNTEEGIDRLQAGIKVYNKDSKQFEPTNEPGLQEARHDMLWKIISQDPNKIKSIIISPDKFITVNDVTFTPAEFSNEGKLTKQGKIEYNKQELDSQQINLTDDASLEFVMLMAPIYSKYQDKWIKERDDEMKNKSLADIASPIVNINKFIEFLSGKAGVGQTAVHITHHQLAMAANLSLNTPQSYWVFPHTKIDGQASFANKLDKDGEWISETLSAFVNAYVDIAKDPYVYDMNAGNRTANMMLMMVRAGASVSWITKFISQPIIKDYIKAQRNNESMVSKIYELEVSKDTLVNSVLAKYGVVLGDKELLISHTNELADKEIEDVIFPKYLRTKDEKLKSDIELVYSTAINDNAARWNSIETLMDNGMFSEERLGEYILFNASKKLGKDDLINKSLKFLNDNPNTYNTIQGHILDLFLEYQRQSKDFQAMVRATSADTKVAQKNMADNEAFFREVELVRFKDRFTNLDKIYSNSVVSEAHNILEKTVKIFKPLYYFRSNPRTKYVMDNLSELYKSFSRSAIFEKIPKAIEADLTTAIVTSDLIDNSFTPKTVFEELMIKHPSNKYINAKGEKAPLSDIIFELNSSLVNITNVEENWVKNGSDPNSKPSILDLRELKDGQLNPMIAELLGKKPTVQYNNYNDFSNKTTIVSSEPNFGTIQVRNRRLTTEQEDVLRNAMIRIKEVSPEMYNDLIRIAVNQYGIQQTTPDSYSKYIPAEDMQLIMIKSFNAFDNLSNEDQVKLLEQFSNQFMQRSLNFTPNVNSVKRVNAKTGKPSWWVMDGDGRMRLPHLVRVTNNRETGKRVTSLIVPRQNIYNGTTTWKYSERIPGRDGSYSHDKLYEGTGIVRGHGQYFLGYELSLKDGNSGLNKYSNLLFNDNQGEVNMMEREAGSVLSDNQFTKGKLGIGESIASTSDNLAFALTNPTVTSPTGYDWSRNWTSGQKQWRDYMKDGIDFNGVNYKDVEQAYQKNKDKYPVGPARDNFMLGLIETKLRKYPKLIEGINSKGGLKYLTDSTHQPTNKNSHWETGGNNMFIKLLTQAYSNVTGEVGLMNEDVSDKLFNSSDKTLKKGSVVEYNGVKYLYWNTNSSGKAQLINTDGTKFSGTLNVDKLKVLGSYPTTMYNGTEYVVTDNNNIYSGATGKLVYEGLDNSSMVQKQRILDSVKPRITSNVVNQPTNKSTFSYKGVTIPTGFELGEQQKEALIDLITYVEGNSNADFWSLEGYAGTGKTTIIGLLQRYLEAKKSRYQPLYFAQLHAAAAQLAFSTAALGNKTMPSTIASSVYERDKRFYFTKKIKDRIKKTPLIIVDEASMIDAEDIIKLRQAADEYGGKIIFMGDPIQLPKVIKDESFDESGFNDNRTISISPVFNTSNKSVLDYVYRQKSGPLLDLLTYVRNSPEYKPMRVENHESVKFLKTGEYLNDLENDVKNDLANTSVVTFTNASVKSMNKRIREIIGKGEKPEVGDVLMGYAGYNNKQVDKSDMANSIKYVIDSITKNGSVIRINTTSPLLSKLVDLEVEVNPNVSTNYYQLSNTDSLDFKLSKDEMDTNNKILSGIFEQAWQAYLVAEKAGFKGAAYEYYLQEMASITAPLSKMEVGNDYIYDPKLGKMVLFNKNDKYHWYLNKAKLRMEKSVDYGYAMTIHKSQGLTIGNVYFDFNSVDKAGKDRKMMLGDESITTFKNALQYVAMSRASNKLRVDLGSTELPLLQTSSDKPLTSLSSKTESEADNLAQKAKDKAKDEPCNK